MNLLYNQIAQSIANTLAGYNSGAWNFFLNEVTNELGGLVEFMKAGPKNVSLLKNNLPYIQDSIGKVNNAKNFTYYDAINGSSEKRSGKPELANPSRDAGNRIEDKFRPTLNDGVGFNVYGGLPTHSVYDEENRVGKDVISGDGYTNYVGLDDTIDKKSLLSKTSRWFKKAEGDYIEKRFKTIHSRFHTEGQTKEDLKTDVSNSAFSEYGLSHGRNLLKTELDYSQGYDNPYCRVWTWHHQYQRLVDDTIRPFRNDSGGIASLKYLDGKGWDRFRSQAEGGFKNGSSRLMEHGTMYDNNGKTYGLVNITPKYEGGKSIVDLKHCMFSIENLAWKGMFFDYNGPTEPYGLSPEQKGPLGGRIMWFPPYDLTFNENSNARWEENSFIGRGEPMYTYSNTSRSGSLSFKLLIDHPAILDYWEKRELPPSASSTVDDIDSKEQEMLRFFAGCSVLKAGTSLVKEPKKEKPKKPKPEPPNKGKDKVIQFLVFYPNNYSGMDDKINGEVDPIKYLINGLGAQKKYVPNAKNDIQDLQTDVSKNFTWNGKTVGGYEMREGGVSLVTDFTDTNAITTIGSEDDNVILMKMFDSKSVSKAIKAPTDKKKAKEWHKKRYYYRADKNTLNQVLLGEDDSYIDKKSYKLNSTGYKDGVNHFHLKDPTYSLTEMFVAVNGDDNNVLSGLYNSESVALIKSVLAGEKGKITKIVCKGMASKDSNSKRSDNNQSKLAKHRAATLQNWLKAHLKDKNIVYSQEEFTVSTEKSNNGKNVNDKVDKLTRMAFAEIHYGAEEIDDTSGTQINVTESGEVESNTVTVINTPFGSTEDTTVENRVLQNVNVNSRYDFEGRFFKQLVEHDPFMTKLLSERIKYFNPVFHSMSPEGFNARLTFLNQCMRQGPTISGADTNNGNANNLAFGRPPVCVLRIGDFYNTKIIITSLTIDYDPLLWDLNQEGIGVMPMIANVTLQFNFIGGSDLGGPIQRLQNALSFNYYANASVYDNRAENIKYKKNGLGEVENFKAFDPQHY